LSFLPLGNATRRESGRPAVQDLVHKLIGSATGFDLVIIDGGAMASNAHVRPFADVVDGIVLVVRAGVTRKDAILATLDGLRINARKLRGTVLNAMTGDAA